MSLTPAFSRETDLTGLWSGEYWYDGVARPTPFVAHLVEAGGDLWGTTLEPNHHAPEADVEWSAGLTGVRGDLSVRFTKLYDPAPGVHTFPVFYSGVADPALTMLEGEWSFERPGFARGRFVLVRVSRGAAVTAAERQAGAPLSP